MGVRRSIVALVLLALVAGCGDDIVQHGAERWSAPASRDPGDPRWSGEVAVDRDTGALSAPGFNELVESATPRWAKAPDTAVAELLHLDRPWDGPVETYLRREDVVMTVTLTRLGDDSIEAIRYRVVFQPGDGLYRFASGVRTVLCHSGRGHRSFETAFCA